MTNDFDIDLVGDKELFAVLNGLDYKVQHKFLKKVVSDAAQVLVKPTKAVIPTRKTGLSQSISAHKKRVSAGKKETWHPPGTGRKSIGKKAGKSTRNAVSFVGPRTNTGNYNTDGYYLKWWERGTKFRAGSRRIEGAYRANLRAVENNMVKSLRKIMVREMKKARKK